MKFVMYFADKYLYLKKMSPDLHNFSIKMEENRGAGKAYQLYIFIDNDINNNDYLT